MEPMRIILWLARIFLGQPDPPLLPPHPPPTVPYNPNATGAPLVVLPELVPTAYISSNLVGHPNGPIMTVTSRYIGSAYVPHGGNDPMSFVLPHGADCECAKCLAEKNISKPSEQWDVEVMDFKKRKIQAE